jgi:hypothetical protein
LKVRSVSWITLSSPASTRKTLPSNGSETRSVRLAFSPSTFWRTEKLAIPMDENRPRSIGVAAR